MSIPPKFTRFGPVEMAFLRAQRPNLPGAEGQAEPSLRLHPLQRRVDAVGAKR